MFYLVTPHKDIRARLISSLESMGITSVFHYQSLHKSTGGKTFSDPNINLPVSDHVSDNLLRLPLFPELTDNELSFIQASIESIKL